MPVLTLTLSNPNAAPRHKVTHCDHCHFRNLATQPPTNSPTAGPRKAIVIIRTTPRLVLTPVHMSIIVPAPTARGAEIKRPAKSRQIASVARLFAKLAPKINSNAIGVTQT